MRKTLIAILLIAMSTTASALDIEQLQQRVRLSYGLKQDFYSAPQTQAAGDSLSLSEAHAALQSADMQQSILPQEGRGGRQYGLGASALVHLDPRQTAWGNAEFSTGKIKEVKWCNALDYSLVGPYVLGDEQGGDLAFRRYDFGGGYSYGCGHWIVGAHIGYRAEIAWRDVDPRLRTVVSDLQASVGVAYRLRSDYLLGVFGALTAYAQNCDIDFYNPINQINTLPLTGLGTYNKRFSGNTNRGSGHSGLGYGAELSFVPAGRRGLMIKAGFESMSMSLMLRNFNNLNLASTASYRTTASAALPFAVSPIFEMTPIARVAYLRRLGTENIFGTAAGASYDKIGTRRPYMLQTLNAQVLVPLEFDLGANQVGLMPRVAYESIYEQQTALARSLKVSAAVPGLSLRYAQRCGRWLFAATGYYYTRISLSGTCDVPGYDAESALQRSVVHTYDMLSARVHAYGMGLQAWRQIGRTLAGVDVGYAHTSQSIDIIDITLKIKF